MTDALRQELAPCGIRVLPAGPASTRTDAVGKPARDTQHLLNQASPAGQALYADAFSPGGQRVHRTARHGQPARDGDAYRDPR